MTTSHYPPNVRTATYVPGNCDRARMAIDGLHRVQIGRMISLAIFAQLSPKTGQKKPIDPYSNVNQGCMSIVIAK